MTIFFLAMFCLAFSNLIAANATNYVEFTIYAVVYGISEGCFIGQLPAVVVDLLPSKEKVGVAIGNLFALISIPVMVGPVFAGQFFVSEIIFISMLNVEQTFLRSLANSK